MELQTRSTWTQIYEISCVWSTASDSWHWWNVTFKNNLVTHFYPSLYPSTLDPWAWVTKVKIKLKNGNILSRPQIISSLWDVTCFCQRYNMSFTKIKKNTCHCQLLLFLSFVVGISFVVKAKRRHVTKTCSTSGNPGGTILYVLYKLYILFF